MGGAAPIGGQPFSHIAPEITVPWRPNTDQSLWPDGASQRGPIALTSTMDSNPSLGNGIPGYTSGGSCPSTSIPGNCGTSTPCNTTVSTSIPPSATQCTGVPNGSNAFANEPIALQSAMASAPLAPL